jgi:hypothetical protein
MKAARIHRARPNRATDPVGGIQTDCDGCQHAFAAGFARFGHCQTGRDDHGGRVGDARAVNAFEIEGVGQRPVDQGCQRWSGALLAADNTRPGFAALLVDVACEQSG